MASDSNFDRDEGALVNLLFFIGDALAVVDALTEQDKGQKTILRELLSRAHTISLAMLDQTSNFPSIATQEIQRHENITQQDTIYLLN